MPKILHTREQRLRSPWDIDATFQSESELRVFCVPNGYRELAWKAISNLNVSYYQPQSHCNWQKGVLQQRREGCFVSLLMCVV